jgi:hypothetical protein
VWRLKKMHIILLPRVLRVNPYNMSYWIILRLALYYWLLALFIPGNVVRPLI